MEVNKEQAEKCRDLGAAALRMGDYDRAIKFLKKSLHLYPLPGVEALLAQAVRQRSSNTESASGTSASASSTRTSRSNHSTSASPERPSPSASSASSGRPNGSSSRPTTSDSSSQSQQGADGRAYTAEQEDIVKQVLRSKEGGRGAHYRVLGLEQDCTEAQIKKAYRKLSLKVHPDKNSAPHASEAFKAVGLAYATLSDGQKRAIYDRYGDEDPDQRGGGGARGPGGMHMRPGQEVSPEDIFNMFFGGGVPGGGMPGMYNAGPGVHVYTNGFGRGRGVHFQAGGVPRRQRRRDRQGGVEEEEDPATAGLGMLFQFLPILLIMFVSFFRFSDQDGNGFRPMPGENKYFSLTHKHPFINGLSTRLTPVKDIPYFVSDRFLRTYYRDRYQLAQVERMVEKAYEQYLMEECKQQREYKQRLGLAARKAPDEGERARKTKLADQFELSRCSELYDLFPKRAPQQQRQQQQQK